MPARQAGSYYRVTGGWGVRWYEGGQRRFRSGFDSKSAARDYFAKVVRPQLDGIPAAPEPLTLREFTDRYLARYEAIRTPARSSSRSAMCSATAAAINGLTSPRDFWWLYTQPSPICQATAGSSAT
jgi:hypothetical protein